MKISHKNEDTVSALINNIRKRYVKEADLTIHQGKLHKYMVMNLDYRNQGKVKIDMTYYLKKILDYLSNKYQGRSITPAENHLFEFNKTKRKFTEKDAFAFRFIMAKLCFLCKRAGPEILTGVAFLMT